jgi:hypothetical protein
MEQSGASPEYETLLYKYQKSKLWVKWLLFANPIILITQLIAQ